MISFGWYELWIAYLCIQLSSCSFCCPKSFSASDEDLPLSWSGFFQSKNWSWFLKGKDSIITARYLREEKLRAEVGNVYSYLFCSVYYAKRMLWKWMNSASLGDYCMKCFNFEWGSQLAIPFSLSKSGLPPMDTMHIPILWANQTTFPVSYSRV